MHSLRGKRVLILSGERGLGKTSLVLELASLLRASGLSVGGVASPSERDGDGLPAEIWAQDLRSGERRRLASRSVELGGPRFLGRMESVPGRAAPPPFSFSREALDWATERFRSELSAKPGLLVLDEVGPLELERDSGFRPVLDEIALASAGTAGQRFLLTVRPSLAAVLAARFPAGSAAVLELTEENRGSLAVNLAKRLAEGFESGPEAAYTRH